jgi:hypothetical protein
VRNFVEVLDFVTAFLLKEDPYKFTDPEGGFS